MDNEFILKQFDEIEQKVERLIEICNALEATNLEQENKINSLEEEIQGKVEAERSYAGEKALIRSKIDGLLAKLDEVDEAETSFQDAIKIDPDMAEAYKGLGNLLVDRPGRMTEGLQALDQYRKLRTRKD